MSYGWDDEVRANAPSVRFRLNDAARSTTVADAVGGAAGSVRGGVTLLCIGAADGGANNFFAGTIDEVAVYKTALSAVVASWRTTEPGSPEAFWIDQIIEDLGQAS